MGLSKEAALKKVQESESPELEVFTVAEHKTFLENYEDSVIAPKVSEIHNQYDKDIFEITGKKRPGNVKTYTFMKEVIGELQTTGKKSVELEREISELKEKIKNNAGNETLKSDLEAVQKLYKEEKEKWGNERTQLLTSHQQAKLENELDRSVMGIKFKDSITDNVRKVVLESVKANLLKSAEIVDGRMIFKDAAGNTLRNKDNALNPYTPEEMLRLELKDILDEGRKIEGTGVKPKIVEVNGQQTIDYVPSASVRTKDDLGTDILSKGLTRESAEYKLAYAKYSPDLPYK